MLVVVVGDEDLHVLRRDVVGVDERLGDAGDQAPPGVEVPRGLLDGHDRHVALLFVELREQATGIGERVLAVAGARQRLVARRAVPAQLERGAAEAVYGLGLAFAPGRERLDRRAQLAARVGERVADAQRPLAVGLAAHEAGALQRGQPGGEHVGGDAAAPRPAARRSGARRRAARRARAATSGRRRHGWPGRDRARRHGTFEVTCNLKVTSYDSLTDFAERLRPSIIGVRRGGSGVVIAPGVAVTLWRNVRADETTVALAGGEAELLGADRSADLAACASIASLPPVPWSDAGPLRIGDPVFALADPAGRGLRATAGARVVGPARRSAARAAA